MELHPASRWSAPKLSATRSAEKTEVLSPL